MSNPQPHVAEKAITYDVLKQFEQLASWPRVPLTKAVDLNPKPERGSLSDELQVSFVPMAAVEAGTGAIDASTVRKYADVKKGYTYFREGDVLFAKITPCMENGKIAVARQLRNGIGFGSTEFHVLRPHEGVDAHYIYYFVSSAQFRGEAAHHMTGAVGQKRVPAAFLEQSEIPLPPIVEQRRIVAEIEKQISRLDEAVSILRRVELNLRRYCQAQIAAACPRPGVALPSGWRWERLPNLGELARGKSRHRPRNDPKLYGGSYPFIQTAEVRASGGRIRSHSQTYNELGLAQSRLWPKGTLCITIAANIAETGIIEFDACFPDSVVGLRVDGNPALARYVELYLRSVKERLHRLAPATAQKNINLQILDRLEIPVPPDDLVESVVASIEKGLSIAEQVNVEVAASLSRANRLKEAQLKAFFAH